MIQINQNAKTICIILALSTTALGLSEFNRLYKILVETNPTQKEHQWFYEKNKNTNPLQVAGRGCGVKNPPKISIHRATSCGAPSSVKEQELCFCQT